MLKAAIKVTYINDLAEYTYGRGVHWRPVTKAIGWLDRDHSFETALPEEELLALIWQFCRVSVAQSRGLHNCQFCPTTASPTVERNGEAMILGTAEIRVFGECDAIYAAPTLLYHYVAAHHYKPPEEFVRAMKDGPKPPEAAYFERLSKLNLAWSATLRPLAAVEAKLLAAKANALTNTKLRRRRWWLRWRRLRKLLLFPFT